VWYLVAGDEPQEAGEEETLQGLWTGACNELRHQAATVVSRLH
jgi:hypothetical protein